MQAAAHEVVHEVVALGHGIEDAAHQPRLVLRGDAAEAEPGLPAGRRRWRILGAGDHRPDLNRWTCRPLREGRPEKRPRRLLTSQIVLMYYPVNLSLYKSL